jgi:flagellar assembly protein FliH
LSNLIKPNYYISLEDTKMIESLRKLSAVPTTNHHQMSEENDEEHDHIQSMKEQILKDAEEIAEEQIRTAMAEAAALKENAQLEIENWWSQKRLLDEEHVEQAKGQGFDEGYQNGKAEAQVIVRQENVEMIIEARTILEQAHQLKQQIIQEAEPFLIELSVGISEKIIQHQLTISPEWIIPLTQAALARKREKGLISLCVAPKHYAYIQDTREELMLFIDPQAELQILPDSTVGDQGCVVRSSFGSIDARIDTQLKEIKAALQDIAMRNDGVQEHE